MHTINFFQTILYYFPCVTEYYILDHKFKYIFMEINPFSHKTPLTSLLPHPNQVSVQLEDTMVEKTALDFKSDALTEYTNFKSQNSKVCRTEEVFKFIVRIVSFFNFPLKDHVQKFRSASRKHCKKEQRTTKRELPS